MTDSRPATSITDWLIEALIPVFIIGLIWTVVTFAITIKGVYYPGQEGALTRVFFLYVMGAVMANRLAGIYGETEKAAAYSIALVAAMGLFALVYTSRYGGMLGGGILANLAIVALVGLASYKLCRESCMDIEKDEESESRIRQRARLRDLQDWYRREIYVEEEHRRAREDEKEQAETPAAAPSKKHPGRWIIYFSLFSMVVFAVGQRLLPADDWRLYERTFACLAGNLVCALALLLLTSLASLRLQCSQKKTRVPAGVGLFWTLAGAALILIVVSLASLPPRPVPPYLAESAAPLDIDSLPDDGAGEEERTASNETWGGLSRQIEMSLEKQERDTEQAKHDFDGTGEGEKGAGSEELQKGKGTGGDEKGVGQSPSAEPSQEHTGSPRRQRSAKTRSEWDRSRTPPKAAPLPRPPLKALQTIGRIVFVALLAAAFLWAALMLLAAFAKLNPLKKLSGRFRSLAARLRNLLAPRRRQRVPAKKLRQALKEMDLYMENPFQNPSLLRTMSPPELVRYTYKAFEQYAHVRGHTPEPGQTSVEFVQSLPDEFHTREFHSLLKLFMLAEYSAHPIPEKTIPQLKEVWSKIEL